jgi:hypothetical protein
MCGVMACAVSVTGQCVAGAAAGLAGATEAPRRGQVSTAGYLGQAVFRKVALPLPGQMHRVLLSLAPTHFKDNDMYSEVHWAVCAWCRCWICWCGEAACRGQVRNL